MRLACFMSLVGLLVVGCGGEGDVTVNSTEDTVCEEIAEVACNNLYQCCTEGEIESTLGVSEPRTEDQCREDVRRICARNSATLNDSLLAGRVTFDAAQMNGCLNAIIAPTETCAIVVDKYPWTEACKDSPWIGTVPAMGACFFAHDCAGAPDTFCAPNQKCTPKPTAGFPCGAGCASAYYCSLGICQAKLSLGAPCTSSSQCAMDLFCDVTATPMPVCAAKAPGGSACTGSAGCISGTCIPGQCMGTAFQCFRDTDCGSRCANNPNLSCTTASQCGTGNCSVGGNPCSSNTNCTQVNDVCVFPVQCLPGDCIGDPVCTAQQLTLDYCDATTQLPLF